MLKLQLAERAVPTMDRYVLDTLAHKAGTIVGSGTAASSDAALRLVPSYTRYSAPVSSHILPARQKLSLIHI